MKYNKGEWSEGYTMLKLLADGVLYGADENLDKLADIYYPIIKILRYEGQVLGYRPGNVVLVFNEEEDEQILELSVEKLYEMSRIMYEGIKNGKGRTFEIPEINEFLNSMYVTNLKAKSEEKKDITIKVHDMFTGLTPTLGFSIKSQIGGKPTLFNASQSSNFIYKITGTPLTESEIEPYDSYEKIKPLKMKSILEYLEQSGRRLEFCGIQGDVFLNNLYLIDSSLPQILSEMILYFYRKEAVTTQGLLALLQERNPCQYNINHNHPFYEYKIKNYLTDVALGMTATEVWNGHYDADGGYIVVKPDGDVLCYHVYNRKLLQEYLLKGTQFDTPSRDRHDYGHIYESDGDYYIKLNAQIRFR